MPLDFPNNPVNGQTYQNYVYDSTAAVWRASNSAQTFPVQVANGGTGATTLAGAQDNLRVGLMPISPSSVLKTGTSATMNALGLVSFTGCSSVILNGVFTSAYKSYVVHFQASQIDAGVDQLHNLRLASGGTGIGTATYNCNHVLNYFGATTFAAANGGYGQTGQVIARTYTATGAAYSVINIISPAEATFTHFTGTGVGTTGASAGISIFGGSHTVATAYDGLQWITSAYQASGTIQVFGVLD